MSETWARHVKTQTLTLIDSPEDNAEKTLDFRFWEPHWLKCYETIKITI